MIDWGQIKQLEEDIGAEDFGDVVILFIEEVDEAVNQLKENPPRDAAQLGPALHFLKGSAYNLGFNIFAEYCSEGEKMADNGQADCVDLEKVICLYTESKAKFIQEAPQHCSFQP
jgi:HPt (histidine-containing phosphotransfer) domain-containing protein